MIKSIIRLSVFVTISVKVAQYVVGAYNFDTANSLLLFITGLTVFYIFVKPLLALTSLPNEGFGLLFMSFILTVVVGYVFTLFIPGFQLKPTVVADLIIFGFVLPSKHLTPFWSNIFSSLLIALLVAFFNWLVDDGRR